MNDFKFNCPFCKKKIIVDAELIGRTAECPFCLSMFVIREPQKPTPERKKPKSLIPARKKRFQKVLSKLIDGVSCVLCGLIISLCVLGIFGKIYQIYSRTSLATQSSSMQNQQPVNRSFPQKSKITADSSSEKSHQTHESKISVSVIVKKKWISYGAMWKYSCEYRLYADDQLIATKNSNSMIVQFKVKVEKGASLRAEMLGKNGFGGIADTLEGPRYKTATANYAGESIIIECT